MNNPDYADYIVELQTRCAHQEDQIQALVTQLQTQQAEIDRMQLQLKWLADNVRQLKAGSGVGEESVDQPPPHY